MERSVLASVLVIGVAAAMLGAGTMAYFSDTEESTGNTFTAGTLEIGLTMGESSANWTFTNLKPGDVICPTFCVYNAGSLTVSDIWQKLEITSDSCELDDWLLVRGFWVGVGDTKAAAIADMEGNEFNPYDFERSISALAYATEILPSTGPDAGKGIDITNDGDVSAVFGDTVLPSGKWLAYRYTMEFKETGEDQNDAQGDSLELTMTLNAEQ